MMAKSQNGEGWGQDGLCDIALQQSNGTQERSVTTHLQQTERNIVTVLSYISHLNTHTHSKPYSETIDQCMSFSCKCFYSVKEIKGERGKLSILCPVTSASASQLKAQSNLSGAYQATVKFSINNKMMSPNIELCLHSTSNRVRERSQKLPFISIPYAPVTICGPFCFLLFVFCFLNQFQSSIHNQGILPSGTERGESKQNAGNKRNRQKMFEPNANQESLVKSLCYADIKSEAQMRKVCHKLLNSTLLDQNLPTELYEITLIPQDLCLLLLENEPD